MKEILELATDNLYVYVCPNCLHQVANETQVCKHCGEHLIKHEQ